MGTPVALRLGCEPMADCARPPHPEWGQPQGGRLMERSEILAAPKVQGAGLELFGMEAAP